VHISVQYAPSGSVTVHISANAVHALREVRVVPCSVERERDCEHGLIACTVRQASNAVWFTHARLLSQPITGCHNRADVLLTQSACSPEASAAKDVSI